MDNQDDITYPPFWPFCDTQRRDKSDHQQDCKKPENREERMVCVHRALWMEGPEGVYRQYLNELGYGQYDDLRDSNRLHGPHRDTAQKGTEEGDKREGCGLVRVGVIEGA